MADNKNRNQGGQTQGQPDQPSQGKSRQRGQGQPDQRESPQGQKRQGQPQREGQREGGLSRGNSKMTKPKTAIGARKIRTRMNPMKTKKGNNVPTKAKSSISSRTRARG